MKAHILNAERGGRAALFRMVEHVKASLMTSWMKSALRAEGRRSEMLGETKESELKKAEGAM